MLAILLASFAMSPAPSSPGVESFAPLTWRADPTDCLPDPIRFERAGLDDEDEDDGFPSELAIVVVTVSGPQTIEAVIPASHRWVTTAIPGFAPRLRC
jgi:hypothetical protein